jgi:hypothetical protein
MTTPKKTRACRMAPRSRTGAILGNSN